MSAVLALDTRGGGTGDLHTREGGTGQPDFLSERTSSVDWGKRGHSAYSLIEGVLRPAPADPGGLDAESRGPDSDAVARRRRLLARAGGGLSSAEVAQRLGVPEAQIDRLRESQRLLAVPDPDGDGWLYPAFQLDDGLVVNGLQDLLAEFRVESVWTRLYVLISEDPALNGRSPIQALKEGDLEMVRPIVRGYGEQGAA